MARTVVSLATTANDAKALGAEWVWLTNDLRAITERLDGMLAYARDKAGRS